MIEEEEKKLILEYWQRLYPEVDSININGEPYIGNFLMCEHCGTADIDDDGPVWQCNSCHKGVFGLPKNWREKINEIST